MPEWHTSVGNSHQRGNGARAKREHRKNAKVNVIHEKTFIISPPPRPPTTTFNESESVTNEFFRYGFFCVLIPTSFCCSPLFLLIWEENFLPLSCCDFSSPIWLALSFNGIHTQVWLRGCSRSLVQSHNLRLLLATWKRRNFVTWRVMKIATAVSSSLCFTSTRFPLDRVGFQTVLNIA